jgi:hypothetical protein
MEAKRFDSLARLLAGQATRRVIATGIASGALGSVLHVHPQTMEAAKRKKDNDQVAAEKKRKKKKVTLCQNGQTIKVSKKARKKFLRQGATPGPCQDTPACTPNPNACAGHECGTVDNGCGVQVSCGECANSEICNNNTGQCGACTPTQNPCGDRVCGTVDNGCGTSVECGPDNGNCPAAPDSKCQTGTGACDPGTGQCVYTNVANDTPCGATNDAEYCTRTCQQGVCTGTPAPDDTPCGMNKCRNTCQGGLCTPNPVVCSNPPNDCMQDCDPGTGTCLADPEPRRNGVSCSSGAGMCVNGVCEVTNATGVCTGANPCANTATTCGDGSGSCVCYSTMEGAGFCIDQNQATCPAQDVRPACDWSEDCLDNEVCVPLNGGPNSQVSCCPGGQFPGFCVPLAARCSQGA